MIILSEPGRPVRCPNCKIGVGQPGFSEKSILALNCPCGDSVLVAIAGSYPTPEPEGWEWEDEAAA